MTTTERYNEYKRRQRLSEPSSFVVTYYTVSEPGRHRTARPANINRWFDEMNMSNWSEIEIISIKDRCGNEIYKQ